MHIILPFMLQNIYFLSLFSFKMQFIALIIVLRYRILINFSKTAVTRQTTHIGKVLFHKYLTNMGYNQSPSARVAAKTMVVTKTIIATKD